MDDVDIRFRRIEDLLRSLNGSDRDDILAIMEQRFQDTESLLSPEQIEELERRLAEPQDIATQEEVDAVFAKYGIKK